MADQPLGDIDIPVEGGKNLGRSKRKGQPPVNTVAPVVSGTASAPATSPSFNIADPFNRTNENPIANG
jgi:hypothetical protein